MVVEWRMEYKWGEGIDRKRLKFNEGDRDNRGELRNMVLLVVLSL